MLSGIRDRVEELVARAGLGAVPLPVVGAAAVVLCVAVAVAVVRWLPSAGPEVYREDDAAPVSARTRSAAEAGEESPSPAPAPVARPERVVVDVVGAVRRPGLYRLAKGARVGDAVEAAGGMLAEAERTAVNLARPLADGEQVRVPLRGEAPAPAPPGAASPVGADGASAGGKVDINSATVEQLDALPGVGPSTAQKIVKEREANGPYRSVEDLRRVPGIGPKKLDSLKDLVTTG